MNNPNAKMKALFLTVIGALLAILSAAHSPRNPDSVSLAQAATPSATPAPISAWQSGSTDGIFLWATIMVIVVIVALVWHRADWVTRKA